jgi:L-alanine-DL-glutamate epimerase-like enolase superfamily enzyme
MKINELELFLVAIRLDELKQTVRSLLVRLVTDSGIEGWGEASSNWRESELSGRQNALLAVLKGRSIFDIEELHTLDALSAAGLRCGVEMAFWDLAGKAVGQPLYNLFGGIYRRRIPVAVRLPGGLPERVGKIARELAAQGFHNHVIASSGRAENDLRILAAVRENVGDRVQLRLDGQAQYSPEIARDLCSELEYADLEFFLDPINTRELYPLASLSRQTPVPLGVWRTIHSPVDVLAAVRCRAGKYLVVDLNQIGGIAPARQCAAIIGAAQTRALLGGQPSLGPGTAAMLHLAAATAAVSDCQECALHQMRDTVLKDPLELVDGMLTVPQGPGLGVEIDRGKVEKYIAS